MSVYIPAAGGAFAALQDVARERQRQEWLKADGRFTHTCADRDMPNGDKLAALGEEFGEVCTEVLGASAHVGVHDSDGSALRKELIQVAAVAVAWVESLDRSLEDDQ